MPVELGFTVLLALKKTFRLPHESSEPDMMIHKELILNERLRFNMILNDRLDFIFKKINLDELPDYSYDFEFTIDYLEDIYAVDLSGLENEYYILVREGSYDKADYEGDIEIKYDDHLSEPLYKRYGNVIDRKNLFNDDLILVVAYFEGG